MIKGLENSADLRSHADPSRCREEAAASELRMTTGTVSPACEQCSMATYQEV